MGSQATDLVGSLETTWAQIANLVPRVLVSLGVLLVGWLLARLIRRVTIRGLRWIGAEQFAERAGIEGFLMRGGVKYTAVTLSGGIAYWLVLFATLITMLNTLGVPSASVLVDQIVLFIPNVVVALVILMVGTVIARFFGSVVYTYLNNVGTSGAEPLATLARLAVLGFVFALAAEQLAIHSEILVSGFQIAFGSVCLALALAFGLGGRHWAARMLDRYWKV
jgi:Mechanosensitive ion channel, conserved TM helix